MLKTTSGISAVLTAGVLSINMSIAQEAVDVVVYLKSAEPCHVTAYTAPDIAPLSEKLNCGEQATLLERQGKYARVKIDENKTVWVSEKNITGTTPAEYEVLRLQKYQKKIEAELASLNKQVIRLSKKSSKLIEALIAAETTKK